MAAAYLRWAANVMVIVVLLLLSCQDLRGKGTGTRRVG